MAELVERLSFTWQYLRPHRARFALGITALLARDAIAVTIPLLIRKAVTLLTETSNAKGAAWIAAAIVFAALPKAGLIFVGASLLNDGNLTIGTLVAFLQYGAKFLRPIQDLSERYGILQISIVSADRVFRLLDTPPPPINATEQTIAPLATDIEFDHVWFTYRQTEPHQMERCIRNGAGCVSARF